MGSSSRSGEAPRRRSPPGHDDPVPIFLTSIPPGPPSPPVVVSSVPCSVWSGSSVFHFDPYDGSVRKTPSDDPEDDLLNLYHTGGGRNENRRAAPDVERCKKTSTKMPTGNMSGGGNNTKPSKPRTGSSSAVTSAPPPRCPSPDQKNDNNQSDVLQVEEEEDLLQESKLLLGMPQNPHYRPIRHHPKHLRHHLVAGYDKSFVEAGRRIQKLMTVTQLERSKEDLRGTLKELDKMGYDVGPLARRLDALEAAVGGKTRDACAARMKIEEARRKAEERKVKVRELQEEIKRLKTKAEEKQEGIEELERWARELEEGLPDIDGIVAEMARTPLL